MKDCNNQFGSLSVARGREEGLPLYEWAPVPLCNEEDCPLSARCPYTTCQKTYCRVIKGIVSSASNNILNNHGLKLTNSQKNRVGQHLMPLYIALARMYVLEAGLLSPQIQTKTGVKMHSVYREIRETLKSIDMIWKNIGLIDDPVNESDFDNYYDNMEAEVQAELKESRVKLKKRKI